MPNRSGRKGSSAEREAAELVSRLLGIPCRRQLGAGRKDDVGDLHGVPHHAIQVAAWARVAEAAQVKPKGAARQAHNAGVPCAATLVRFRGGTWRCVLTPEQWGIYARAVLLLAELGLLDRLSPDATELPDPADQGARRTTTA